MSNTTDPHEKEWDVYVARWFDGTLNEKQADRLAEMLREQPSRCRDLRRQFVLETALRDIKLGAGNVPTAPDVLGNLRKNPIFEDDQAFFKQCGRVFAGFPDCSAVPPSSLDEAPGWNELALQLQHLDLSSLKQDSEALDAQKAARLLNVRSAKVKPSRWTRLQKKLDRMLNVSRFMLTLGCLFLVTAILFLSLKTYWQSDWLTEQSTDVSVSARLTAGAFTRWDDGDRLFTAGEAIGSQVMRLTEGFASLRLLEGASVIVQGPAEFSVDPDGQVACKSGRLFLDVPPQKKPLRVSLPEFTVIVRGTKFSVDASPLGSKIQLHEGTVDVEHVGNIVNIRPGQLFVVTNKGDVRRLDADATTFVSLDRMKEMSAESDREEKRRQEERRKELQSDPSLVLQLDFDRLPPSFMNVWTGYTTTEGRLPGTKALKVETSESHTGVKIDKEFNEITLTAWLRLDTFGKNASVIFTSQPLQRGLRWQVEKDGTARLLLPSSASKKTFEGFRAFSRQRQGVWTHLAVTVDIETKTIEHFVNGRKEHEEYFDARPPFRIDEAMIGNIPAERKGQDLHFNGCLDDLLIFDRKLDAEEILNLIR